MTSGLDSTPALADITCAELAVRLSSGDGHRDEGHIWPGSNTDATMDLDPDKDPAGVLLSGNAGGSSGDPVYPDPGGAYTR